MLSYQQTYLKSLRGEEPSALVNNKVKNLYDINNKGNMNSNNTYNNNNNNKINNNNNLLKSNTSNIPISYSYPYP